MQGGAEAVKSVDGFVVCGGYTLGGLAVVCFEKDAGMFVDACFIEVESPEAANVIDSTVKEMGLESAYVLGVVETQDGDR